MTEWSELVVDHEKREIALDLARREPVVVTASAKDSKGERLLLYARAFAHPRDARVRFEEAAHKYFLDGKPMPMSVSGFWGQFFSHFDSEGTISSCIGKWRKNTKGKYYPFLEALRAAGVPESRDAEIIKTLWELNGDGQSSLGTGLHRAIELDINEELFEEPPEEPDLIEASASEAPLVPHLRGVFNLVPKAVPWALGFILGTESGEKPDLSVAPSRRSKEFEYYLKWKADHPELLPVRQEMNVFSEEYLLVGQLDALYYDTVAKMFKIVDWKRTKEMIKDPNGFTFRGKHPFDTLWDTNFGHYSIQQGTYAALLRLNYGIDVGSMTLLQLHPNFDGYIEHDVPDLREQIGVALEMRKKSI